jgi:DNA-binding transcriptional LysR family regulator
VNLNHLAVFHAVVEAGGVTAGAERLGITQPAASKQIKELESSLRLKLFDRVGRGLVPTESGRILAGYARRLFALEAEAEQAVIELREVARGTLMLGASTSIGCYLIPVVLTQFHREYPGVEVRVEIGNTEQIHRDLREHRLDLGLTEGLVPGHGVASDVFARDELVAITSPGHPITSRRKVRAKDFVSLPFIHRERGSGTRQVVEYALGSLDLRAAEVMSLGDTEAIKRVVASGIGVSIVSRLSVQSELARGELAIIELADLKIPRPLHRVRPREIAGGPVINAFDRVLAATLPAAFRP